MFDEELKKKEEVELICPDCRLPIAGTRPRTDVTRYLADLSRCRCREAALAQDDTQCEGARVPEQTEITIKVAFSSEDAGEILKDRFKVLSFLGRGGMGSVFKVEELSTGKIFAVKLLNPQMINDEHSVKRFEQEAKAAMHLTNANLAAVYEYGVGKNGTPFLVMDYLEGETLDQLLKKETLLGWRRAIDIFIQLCEAVNYAHSSGVLHRDIKPGNIMLTHPTTDMDFVKLFDFGIAKALPGQAIDLTQDMTQTGEIFGSPLYMSPEQCKGLAVDERGDIYSLGCVMYKTLTGKNVFEGKNFIDTVLKIVGTEAVELDILKSELPASLLEILSRCLSKDPEYRYKNAALLQADLERVRDGQRISRMKSAPRQSSGRRSSSKRPFLIARIALLLVVIGAFLFNSGLKHQPPPVVPLDQYNDAQRLDSLSYGYFSQGKYEQAIPLLEFGIKTYKEDGKKAMNSGGREDNYLAENYSHLGKCYLMLKRYKEAVPYYQESLRMFCKWGNYSGSMMPEAVNDYAEVLRGLGKSSDAEKMLQDFQQHNNLTKVP